MTVWRKVPDMSHDEWLMWRTKGLGGSDAPAIMGVSPWATPYQKWEEKVHGKRSADNASKKFGRDTEKASRMEFEDLVGLKMNPANIENVEFPWLLCSLDGMDTKDDVIVEIKKANKEDHKTACEGRVPDKYYPQCQHILLVTGKTHMYYFSSPASKLPGKIVHVPRDSEYISGQLFPKLKEFWEMVLTKKPPPFMEHDIHPMDGDEEWERVSNAWKNINFNVKILEEKRDHFKNEMIRLGCGNAVGNGVNLHFEMVKGRVDYETAIDDYIADLRVRYPGLDFPDLDVDAYRKDPFIKWTARDIA